MIAPLKHQMLATARTFFFTEGNSKEQKVALWVAMGLFIVGVIGTWFGFIDQTDPQSRYLLDILGGVMLFLWGRTQGHEAAIMQGKSEQPK